MKVDETEIYKFFILFFLGMALYGFFSFKCKYYIHLKIRLKNFKHLQSVSKASKILCLILTHPGREEYALSVSNTWGKRCGKLLFLSLPLKINIPVLNLTLEKEGREFLWEKVRKGFQYAFDNHLNEFDWFLKADDDTYIFMENLEYFLSRYNPNKTYFFGRRFKTLGGYNSGGGGYVLSRKSLIMFVEAKKNIKNVCKSGVRSEDVAMGNCLNAMKIAPSEARDVNDKELFHCFNLKNMLDSNPDDKKYWIHGYNYYSYYVGRNCCSTLPISFHYTDSEEKYLLDYVFHNFKVKKNIKIEEQYKTP